MRYRYGVTMGSFFFGAVIPISSLKVANGLSLPPFRWVQLRAQMRRIVFGCVGCVNQNIRSANKMSVWVAG